MYISKNKRFFSKRVKFWFLPNQDFESSKIWKKLKYNPFRNKCLILDIFL